MKAMKGMKTAFFMNLHALNVFDLETRRHQPPGTQILASTNCRIAVIVSTILTMKTMKDMKTA
jgi:hypothetical protein